MLRISILPANLCSLPWLNPVEGESAFSHYSPSFLVSIRLLAFCMDVAAVEEEDMREKTIDGDLIRAVAAEEEAVKIKSMRLEDSCK